MQDKRQPLHGLWRWWAASSRLRWAFGTQWQRHSWCPRSLPRAVPGTSRTLTSRQSASWWRNSSECLSGTDPESPWSNQEEKLSSFILGSENTLLLRFRKESQGHSLQVKVILHIWPVQGIPLFASNVKEKHDPWRKSFFFSFFKAEILVNPDFLTDETAVTFRKINQVG